VDDKLLVRLQDGVPDFEVFCNLLNTKQINSHNNQSFILSIILDIQLK
jgi:hypothetical protein